MVRKTISPSPAPSLAPTKGPKDAEVNSCEIQLAGADYVLIPKPALKREEVGKAADDVKSVAISPSPAIDNHLRSMALRGARKQSINGAQHMAADVLLGQKISVTSASGVDLTTVSALQPGSSSGFSSFAAVFDICRCKAIRVHTQLFSSGTPTVFAATGAVAYDPSNDGVYSSVARVLEAKFHLGPLKLGNLYGNVAPNAMSRSGFLTWKAKPQEDLFLSGVTSDLVGGQWFPSTSTSSIIGYLKPFIESPGSLTSTLLMYVVYEMEFAYRT